MWRRQMLAVALAMAVAAPAMAADALPPELAGSAWTLENFQSSDNAIGVLKPAAPDQYQLMLEADGSVAMKLDCNRGFGSWKATAVDATNGTITFGPMGMSMAACPPGSMDTRIARDMEHVRTYVLRDGRLFLNLWADAGTYAWKRMAK